MKQENEKTIQVRFQEQKEHYESPSVAFYEMDMEQMIATSGRVTDMPQDNWDPA